VDRPGLRISMDDAAALSPGPPPGGERDPTPGIALLIVAAVLHAGGGGFLGIMFGGMVPREVGSMLIGTQFVFAVLATAIAYRMWETEGGGLAATALGGVSLVFNAVATGPILGLMVGAPPAVLEIVGGILIVSGATSREGATAEIPPGDELP